MRERDFILDDGKRSKYILNGLSEWRAVKLALGAGLLLSCFYFNYAACSDSRDRLREGWDYEKIDLAYEGIEGPPIEFITRPGRKLAYYFYETVKSEDGGNGR